MVAPKIFISHSAKSAEDAKILWEIHDRLVCEGFEVLLDVARLSEDLGGPWRTTLNTWIEICDSAILVFNELAQTSNWVVYESALLKWRRDRDPEWFRLIPVVVPPADPSNLGKGRFEPHEINEAQALRSDQPCYLDLICEALKPVKDKLINLNVPFYARFEQQLSLLLHEIVDDTAIVAAAMKLGFDLSRWQPSLDRRRALAQLLLQADVLTACKVMREFFVGLGGQQLRDIREFLAPTWVSCNAVEPIERIALSESSADRCLALNTVNTKTLKMYLRRASALIRSWEDISVSPPLTTEPAMEIVQQVVRAYCKRLFGSDAEDKSVLADAEDALRDIQATEPVFLLFNFAEAEPSETEMAQIRARLPAVTFFMATGNRAPSAKGDLIRGARFLEPALEPEVEKEALNRYRQAQMIPLR